MRTNNKWERVFVIFIENPFINMYNAVAIRNLAVLAVADISQQYPLEQRQVDERIVAPSALLQLA
jgi:hypothetical protein